MLLWGERSAEIVDSKTPEVTLRLHMFNLYLLAQTDGSHTGYAIAFGYPKN